MIYYLIEWNCIIYVILYFWNIKYEIWIGKIYFLVFLKFYLILNWFFRYIENRRKDCWGVKNIVFSYIYVVCLNIKKICKNIEF